MISLEQWISIHSQLVARGIFTILGGIIAMLAPVLPMYAIFTFAVFLDVITAFRLSKRVRKLKGKVIAQGKFESRKFSKVFTTLLVVYSLIFLGHLIDDVIFPQWELHIPNLIAGAACFWQMWSILENEASCNGAGWAKFLQRFLVDKASRHFDANLEEAIKASANSDNSVGSKSSDSSNYSDYSEVSEATEDDSTRRIRPRDEDITIL